MASSPFSPQLKLYRIATFSQLFFSLKCNSISLHRIKPPRSRNVHHLVYGNSCHFSLHRNLLYYSQRQTNISLIAFDAKNSESRGGAEDHNHHGLQPLFKFFSAIAKKITPTKSDILADQWPFLSNFLSFLRSFQRKKQLWGFFSYLIEVFGNHIEIVVKQTLYDGLNIGVQWKFESEKLQIPLGRGFSIYISHSYKGKAMIRNSETFIKPLLHLLPFRLKIMGSLEGLRETIGSLMAWEWESDNSSQKICCIVIALLVVTALLFFLRIPPFKVVLKLSHKS